MTRAVLADIDRTIAHWLAHGIGVMQAFWAMGLPCPLLANWHDLRRAMMQIAASETYDERQGELRLAA